MANDKQDLNELKNYAYALKNKETSEYDGDKLYTFAVAAQNDEIIEDEEMIHWAFRTLLINEFVEKTVEETFDRYPLAKANLPAIVESLSAKPLHAIAGYFKKIGDGKNFFLCSERAISNYVPGFHQLKDWVETLLAKDACLLNLASCYKNGIGTDKDYPTAFAYYLSYHTDYIVILNGNDEFPDNELADLYKKLKAESDAGMNYPGLHYSLAVMVNEGFGTAYRAEEYATYYSKEMENYRDGNNADSKYREGMENYDTYWSKRKRYFKVKEADSADIAVGDVVRMGKYNHRDILWHVLRIENGNALLLSTEILESGYVVNELFNNEIFSVNDDIVIVDNSSYQKSAFRFALKYAFNFNKDPNKIPYLSRAFNDYFFLLPSEEIEKCNLTDDVLFAQPREQAASNGRDYIGLDVDEETGVSPWWTSTDGFTEGFLEFVDIYGNIDQSSMESDTIGIRPAAWLKLRK